MFNLILKDILIQKKYMVISIIYAFFFTFIFSSNNMSMAFGVVPIMISYMLLIGACGFDDKNKCEIMLNSLPIKRSNIVISKYLSIFVFIFIGLFLCIIAEIILNFSGFVHLNKLINIEDILTASVGSLIFGALYLPFYFKLGYQKARYFLIVVFFAIFAGSYTLAKFSKGATPPNFIVHLNSQPDWLATTFIIATALIILLVSMLLSIKFYINKDL